MPELFGQAQRCTHAGRCAPLRGACALSPARFVLVCDACAPAACTRWATTPGSLAVIEGEPISVTQGTSTRSEAPSMSSKGGDPRAPRATIHALREGDPRAPREAIHTVLHALQGRRSTRASRRRPRGSLGGGAAARGSCRTRTEWRWTGRAMSSSRTTANTASSSSPQLRGR